MHNKIVDSLKAIAEQHHCKILFAAESGSRAWGFASPDSDYDVRTIYIMPIEWYLSTAEKPQDTFGVMLPHDLDIAGWELRKALRLFMNCNLALYEWLGSPIFYWNEHKFAEHLRSLIPQYFNPLRATYHYLAIHQNALESLDSLNTISIKKLFYALRGLFAASWSARYRTMPPTEFSELLRTDLIPAHILEVINSFRSAKAIANEKERITCSPKLLCFFQTEVTDIQKFINTLKSPKIDPAPIDSLLQQLIINNTVTGEK